MKKETPTQFVFYAMRFGMFISCAFYVGLKVGDEAVRILLLSLRAVYLGRVVLRVLSDSRSKIIGMFSKATGLLWEAEVKAILTALLFCKEHNMKNILIESGMGECITSEITQVRLGSC